MPRKAPERLTEEQKKMVEDALPDLNFMLGSRYYAGYVRRLGKDDAYQVGCLALIHAAGKYNPALIDPSCKTEREAFLKYAEWWLRHYLTREVLKSCVMRDKGNRIAGRAGPRNLPQMQDSDEYRLTVRDGDHEANADTSDEAWEAMRSLDPKEHMILMLVSKGMQYKKVAEEVGCSRESVRLIHEAALNKIKYGRGGGSAQRA